MRRLLFLCLGLIIMAFGVAFSVKAGLGTSPISSVPYAASEISGLTVGVTTIVMNFLFVVLQIAILRREYDWFQLLQFPAAVVFGCAIDLAEYALAPLPCAGYAQQWLLCLIGIFLVALGVSVEVMANLVTTAGEGVVLAICRVVPVKFGNMKMIFDVTLVCISIAPGLIFLRRLSGVREGTVAAAILVGQVTKLTGRWMKKVEAVCL